MSVIDLIQMNAVLKMMYGESSGSENKGVELSRSEKSWEGNCPGMVKWWKWTCLGGKLSMPASCSQY